MVKVLHVITGLSTGGAEMMLLKLLGNMDRSRVQSMVVSLTDKGPIGLRIEALGVPVVVLNLRALSGLPMGLWRLLRQVRRFKPDLAQGWMYHGNLFASFLVMLSPRKIPVVWNIRQSIAALEDEKPMTARLIRLGAKLSQGPAMILYNSSTAREQHEALGYRHAKAKVIPNGFELTRFHPDDGARLALRSQLGLGPEAPLIGMVARYHPMKDHSGFLRAAAHVHMRHPSAHFVLVGRGVTRDAPALREQIASLGLDPCVHILGEREDLPFITAALDISVNASWRGEGFSNAIGEAMACAVPCVVTDVGDSAWIVGSTGRVVPAQDAQAMAKAIADLLDAGPSMRTSLGQAARARMIDMFDLAYVSARYQDLYEELCGSGRG